jgi:hypothetical protein
MSSDQQRMGKYLLTGMLSMTAMQEMTKPNSAFKILDVRVPTDASGQVLPRFEIDMPSGTYTIAIIDNGEAIQEEP